MILELTGCGLKVETEFSITVHCEGKVVGAFLADLLVERRVLVELKAKGRIIEPHEAQLINYLRATEIEIGLLFNFEKRPEFKRKYFSNKNKSFGPDSNGRHVLESLFETIRLNPPDPHDPRFERSETHRCKPRLRAKTCRTT
jgi:GxxExxY protein